ncbi:unnamed protein product [Triticum turgidum subsp. durum]|uniref:NPH3 domain-containing protein n=1 Tax=Triticum turgidum subsp. durum TaxID=4567 RepID=A0A9R0RBR5_TRITD|nr:unnamed protein product [Triticum turgidum subsp. durum]
MDKVWDLKVHVDGRHTLLLHQSVMCAFSGRLRAMATRETKAKSGGGAEAASMCVDLAGFPGGGEGFDLVAQFCYSNGRLPPLRPSDLPLVHCAAAFLEMTEEVRAGNLLAQAEAFVDVGLCYWSWADTPESVKRSCLGGGGREWWFDDVASLSPPTVEQAMQLLGCYGVDNKNLTLTRFLLHYLPRAAALRKVDDSGSLVGLADTAVHGVAHSGSGAAFSCRGLFWVLRIVSAVGLSKECRRKMEALVGQMLDQATLDDLLVSGDGSGVYDVGLVTRLVRVFVSSVGEEEAGCSSEKMRKVGRLMDKYLAEISPDHGLRVSRFLAVAESLPDSARDCYDGVYRAVDIYLESHAELTVEECATLCRCLNYKKLTLEACKDLTRNRRIPTGVSVQALSLQLQPNALRLLSSSSISRWVVADGEKKEALRLSLRRMQGRLTELQMTCKGTRGKTRASSGMAAKGSKSLGGRGLPWMC